MTETVFAKFIPELEEHHASVDIALEEDHLAHSKYPTAAEILYLCPFLMFSTIVASFGGILFGFDTAALNGILIMPPFIEVMGGDHMNDAAWADRCSWITSSLLLGAAFSSFFAAIFADTVGRKLCINISSLTIFIGACVQAFARCWQVMIIGRIVVGAGIGLLSATVPLYLAEVSPKSIRGAISSLFELTVAFGILLAFLTTWWFNKYSFIAGEQGHGQAEYTFDPQENNWRYILIIQAAMAAILSTFLIPVPESPRWLISTGKTEKAREVLQSLRWCAVAGQRQSPDGVWLNITYVDVEYDEMLTDYNSNIQKVAAPYDFSPLLQSNMLLRTSIAISIKVLQQLTGINSIMYYSSIIFETVGIRPDVTTVITGLVNCLATLISVIFIDHWGRRLLLISGSVGMCLSLLIVGIIVLITTGTDTGSSDTGSVASGFIAGAICFFIINFAYSYGPIAWLYPAEIFPMHVRAKGVYIHNNILSYPLYFESFIIYCRKNRYLFLSQFKDIFCWRKVQVSHDILHSKLINCTYIQAYQYPHLLTGW